MLADPYRTGFPPVKETPKIMRNAPYTTASGKLSIRWVEESAHVEIGLADEVGEWWIRVDVDEADNFLENLQIAVDEARNER